MKNNYRIFITLLGILILLPALAVGLPETGGIQSGGTGNTSQEIISIDPISPHCVNATFPVSGNTSLPPGTSLRITIRRGSFSPGIPPQQIPWYDTIHQETTVTPGDERGNRWTYALNTTGSYSDEYLVYVEPYSSENVRADAIFVLNATCISGASAMSPESSPAGTPFIALDPGGTHATGEVFFINGTTNLAASNDSLLLQIGSAEFNPGGFGSSFYTANVSIHPGDDGVNSWSATILPSRWQVYTEPPDYYPTPTSRPADPGRYLVAVSSRNPYGPESSATQQLVLVSPEAGIPEPDHPVSSGNNTVTRGIAGMASQPATATAAVPVYLPVSALGIMCIIKRFSRR